MKKAKVFRLCEHCQKRFVAKRPWQKHHSVKCRKAAFDERRAELIRRGAESLRQSTGV